MHGWIKIPRIPSHTVRYNFLTQAVRCVALCLSGYLQNMLLLMILNVQSKFQTSEKPPATAYVRKIGLIHIIEIVIARKAPTARLSKGALNGDALSLPIAPHGQVSSGNVSAG